MHPEFDVFENLVNFLKYSFFEGTQKGLSHRKTATRHGTNGTHSAQFAPIRAAAKG